MYTYEVFKTVSGAWKLRLLENGVEVGGGVWGDEDEAREEAIAEGELWVQSRGFEDLEKEPAMERPEAGASELLLSLLMVKYLMLGPHGRDALCEWMGCSVATLKRRIDELRGLGVHIESVKQGRVWVYHVANPQMCEPRLSQWIELERSRSLVGGPVVDGGPPPDWPETAEENGMFEVSFWLTPGQAAALSRVLNRQRAFDDLAGVMRSPAEAQAFKHGCLSLVGALQEVGVPESVEVPYADV